VKVERSIAEGPSGPLSPLTSGRAGGRLAAVVVGLLLVLGAAVLYAWSNPEHYNQYNHFVWQADAFLHGKVSFDFPVPDGTDRPANWYFQDIYPLFDASGRPTGQVLLPFPPLPALVLLPFVAAYGLFADQEAVAVGLAAIGVGAAWWMLGGLRIRFAVRALTTILFATGTVWWWAAAVGSTWYLAHLVAVIAALLAVGVALRHDPRADAADVLEDAPQEDAGGAAAGGHAATGGGWWSRIWPLDGSQVLAGLLLGIAATARLPLVFAAPFFILVGGGGTRARRLVSAGVGGVLPVAALLVYTQLTTGAWLHPGYDYQYQLEANGYPTLGYHPEWSVEDLRYIPQNLGIMFGALPVVAPDVKPNTLGFGETIYLCVQPDAQRSLFDPDCPLVMPIDIGTSILLSAPGLLIALFAVRRHPRARLTVGVGVTVVVIALFNLAHFSQGWVQWGYRFSLDFIPFLLPLVALGAGHADGRVRGVALALVIAGAAINLWGVLWGQLLGW
jgi:hypothetical protein